MLKPTHKCIGCGSWLEFPRWRLALKQTVLNKTVYMARCAFCAVYNTKIIKETKNEKGK